LVAGGSSKDRKSMLDLRRESIRMSASAGMGSALTDFMTQYGLTPPQVIAIAVQLGINPISASGLVAGGNIPPGVQQYVQNQMAAAQAAAQAAAAAAASATTTNAAPTGALLATSTAPGAVTASAAPNNVMLYLAGALAAGAVIYFASK
jgi:hypothetical protein